VGGGKAAPQSLMMLARVGPDRFLTDCATAKWKKGACVVVVVMAAAVTVALPRCVYVKQHGIAVAAVPVTVPVTPAAVAFPVASVPRLEVGNCLSG
jgi:hypothetical protein